MAHFTALYDANVLYPAPLRDLLMQLALRDIYLARWTDEIHGEWMSSLLKQRPDLKPEALQRTRDLMNSHVRDCLVTDYQALIPGLKLPDDKDRHVLAAAIKGHAQVIVTYNTRDFPADYLEQFGVEAQHPDDFLVYQFDLHKAAVCKAVQLQRASLKNPPKVVEQLLENYSAQQLPMFVERIRLFRDLL